MSSGTRCYLSNPSVAATARITAAGIAPTRVAAARIVSAKIGAGTGAAGFSTAECAIEGAGGRRIRSVTGGTG